MGSVVSSVGSAIGSVFSSIGSIFGSPSTPQIPQISYTPPSGGDFSQAAIAAPVLPTEVKSAKIREADEAEERRKKLLASKGTSGLANPLSIAPSSGANAASGGSGLSL